MFGTDQVEATEYEEFRIELLSDPTRSGFILRASPPHGEVVTFDYQPPVSRWEVDEVFAGLTRATVQVTRSVLRDTADEVRALGERLFNSVCDSRVATLYNHAFGAAWESGRNLRLRIVLNHEELAELPWEFLFDPSRKDFVTLSMRSPFVRQWQVPSPPTAAPAVESPLRVLMAAAEVNKFDFGADKEIELLSKNIGGGRDAELDLVDIIPEATPTKLLDALAQNSYHVLHLIISGATPDAVRGWVLGTGGADSRSRAESLLLWSDQDGKRGSQFIDISTLLDAVSRQKELQLICLSGDCTDWIACQLAKVCPATIGWRGINTFEAYYSFTRGFYDALLRSFSLEAAVTQGRKAIDAEYPGGKEWGMPVFYMQTPQGLVVRNKKRAAAAVGSSASKSKKQSIKKPSDPAAHREWKKIHVLLDVAEQNYAAVTAEVDKHEAGAVPDYISSQMNDLKGRISELKARLKGLA